MPVDSASNHEPICFGKRRSEAVGAAQTPWSCLIHRGVEPCKRILKSAKSLADRKVGNEIFSSKHSMS